MAPGKGTSYYDVLTRAVDDITANGYDSAERVAYWMGELKRAAERTLRTDAQMQEDLRRALGAVYHRMVERGQIARYHSGVGRFTIEKLRPQLRAELDRRIVASTNLIKLNREEAVQKTMRRFSGWATSVPSGGTDVKGTKAEERDSIRKPLANIKFEQRRVVTDQTHKLVANISEIVAVDGKAIAATWHSNWRQKGYDYREDHKDRDQHVYMLRGNWALEKGLVKPGPDGFYDKITSAGEEPFCRCYIQWIYALRDLPAAMLTRAGETALAEARAKIKTMRSYA